MWRWFELFSGFEIIDDLLMWDAIEFEVMILVLNTRLGHIEVDKLTKFDLAEI